MAPSDLRRKVIFFCCTNKQGARREGPLTSLLGNGFSFFKGLNLQLNVNTPRVSEYLVDAVIALKVVPGDCFLPLSRSPGQVELLWLGLRRPTRDLRRGTAPGPSR